MGADSLTAFFTWKDPLDLLAACEFAVFPRPGVCIEDADPRILAKARTPRRSAARDLLQRHPRASESRAHDPLPRSSGRLSLHQREEPLLMTPRKGSRPKAPTLCLIDGTALAFRSHYAFIRQPLTNSSGMNVSAVYGFADKAAPAPRGARSATTSPSRSTRAEPTFRHEAYEEYKATREEAPDEMIPQFPAFGEFVELIGVTALELPGYEADDVIGTLRRQGAGEGHPDGHRLGRQGLLPARGGRGHRVRSLQEGRVRAGGGRGDLRRASGQGHRGDGSHGRRVGQRPGRSRHREEDGARSDHRVRDRRGGPRTRRRDLGGEAAART